MTDQEVKDVWARYTKAQEKQGLVSDYVKEVIWEQVISECGGTVDETGHIA